ncbi:hypothetical protein JB92DRAFT_3132784 [Gautieria morchelliformis]|nr:hypothetical protein JB92DRAFT_3132784 [Gautieria morchelliformis]
MSTPTTRSHDSDTSPPSQTTARPYSYGPWIIPPQAPLSIYPTDASNIYAIGEGSDRTAHNRLLPIGYAGSLPLAPGRSPVVPGAGGSVTPTWGNVPRVFVVAVTNGNNEHSRIPAFPTAGGLVPQVQPYVHGTMAMTNHTGPSSFEDYWSQIRERVQRVSGQRDALQCQGSLDTGSRRYGSSLDHNSASLRNTCPDSVEFMQEGFPLIGDEPVAETIDTEYALR